LLDVLRQETIVASFFVIGREAQRYPELVRRIAAEGHVVANHTYSHGDPARTSPRQFADEVRRTDELLAAILGGSSRGLLRPPFGRLTFSKMIRSWRAGQTIVHWNVDPRDFECRSGQELRARLEGRVWQGGDLVLLHDNQPHTAEVIPWLSERVRAVGLSFVTVDQWAR
jgi:peptidoglycan/xylan/chitin deacetylase (PgdA/CDA1 family)